MKSFGEWSVEKFLIPGWGERRDVLALGSGMGKTRVLITKTELLREGARIGYQSERDARRGLSEVHIVPERWGQEDGWLGVVRGVGRNCDGSTALGVPVFKPTRGSEYQILTEGICKTIKGAVWYEQLVEFRGERGGVFVYLPGDTWKENVYYVDCGQEGRMHVLFSERQQEFLKMCVFPDLEIAEALCRRATLGRAVA